MSNKFSLFSRVFKFVFLIKMREIASARTPGGIKIEVSPLRDQSLARSRSKQ